MRFPWFKVILFLCVWYEIAVELHVNDTVALAMAVMLVAGWWFAPQIFGHFAQVLGPLTCGLIVRLVVWLVLFWWLAPPFFRNVPFVIIVGGAVLLALVGARSRTLLVFHGVKRLQAKLRENSGLVVIGSFAAVGLVFFAIRNLESAWLLLGYALLPGLPFLTGWQLAAQAAPRRPDAKLGDEETMRDEGFSADR